jgi:hypothetical protein
MLLVSDGQGSLNRAMDAHNYVSPLMQVAGRSHAQDSRAVDQVPGNPVVGMTRLPRDFLIMFMAMSSYSRIAPIITHPLRSV